MARSRPRAPSRCASRTRRKRWEKKRSAAPPTASAAVQPNSASAARLKRITRWAASTHMMAMGAALIIAPSLVSLARSLVSTSRRVAGRGDQRLRQVVELATGKGPSVGTSP